MDTAFAPASVAPSPASPAPAPDRRGALGDFDTFLRMLTAQLRNQDPTDPMDSADYAVQLATFAGVEQQVRTNELIAALSGQMAVSALGQMAAWVGQEVRAAMPAHFSGSPVTVSPNPLVTAEAAELVVRDDRGQEIERRAIPVAAGPVEWAGVTADGHPLPAGPYRFEVVSLAGGQVLRTDPAEVYARVREVRSEGGQAVLVMEGGATIPASAATALRRSG
jgi:flagellar basal-body rod modification protein FlgD